MKTCGSCVFWSPNRDGVLAYDDGTAWCSHPKVSICTATDFGCSEHMGAEATEMNVPQHTSKGTMELKNQTPVEGPVEILIVTYRKDFPWLIYALKLINKYCRGFHGVTLAVPHIDRSYLSPAMNYGFVRFESFDEDPSKGMLNHMVQMASAEKLVPPGTRYVMHMDADCMFHTPSTPEDFFYDNKPQYLFRSWESLSSPDPDNPGAKVTSDCAQWHHPTTVQLGKPSEIYAMCRHPTVFPIEFYPLYRDRISAIHGDFEKWMLAGRNVHPQDRMDFTAMGEWAWACMRDAFYWVNCGDRNPYPKDRLKAYWSHGGITPDIKAEIEGYLNRYEPTPDESARMANNGES